MIRTLTVTAVLLALSGCSLIPIPSTGWRHDRMIRANAPPDMTMRVISCDRPPEAGELFSVRECMVSIGEGKPQKMIVIFAPEKREDEICR